MNEVMATSLLTS